MLPIVFMLAGAPALAQECPDPPDHSAAIARAFEQLQNAKNDADAQQYSNLLWGYWTDAPDATAQAYLDAGMGAREVADFARAREALDALVAYCPEYAEGYNQRAFVSFLSLDFEAALVDLDRALELSPQHVGALSGRGLTLLQLGRVKAGYTAIRQALELNPWIPERAYLPPETGQEL